MNRFRFETIEGNGGVVMYAGDTKYLCAAFGSETMDLDVACNREGRQFRYEYRQAIVHVGDGWEMSIIWGNHTYSDNHHSMYMDEPFTETPAEVEIAVRPQNTFGVGDAEFSIASFVSVPEFERMYERLTTLPSGSDIDVHELRKGPAGE